MFDLYNEDTRNVLKTLKDNSVDCIVTDPPYKVTSRGSSGTMSGYWATTQTMKGKIFKNNETDISEWLPDIERVLKDGSHFYIMTNHINLFHYLEEINKCKNLHFTKCLIWDKQSKICGMFYMGQFEYVLFGHKGKGVAINNCGDSDIVSVKVNKMKDKDGNILHETEKPVQLMEYFIKNSTKEGDTVIDPFMGIGSTGVACKNLNRNFIGIEIDPKYFDTAKQRINQNDDKNDSNSLF